MNTGKENEPETYRGMEDGLPFISPFQRPDAVEKLTREMAHLFD